MAGGRHQSKLFNPVFLRSKRLPYRPGWTQTRDSDDESNRPKPLEWVLDQANASSWPPNKDQRRRLATCKLTRQHVRLTECTKKRAKCRRTKPGRSCPVRRRRGWFRQSWRRYRPWATRRGLTIGLPNFFGCPPRAASVVAGWRTNQCRTCWTIDLPSSTRPPAQLPLFRRWRSRSVSQRHPPMRKRRTTRHQRCRQPVRVFPCP